MRRTCGRYRRLHGSRGVFNRSLDILSTNSEQTDPGARLVDGEMLFTLPNVLSTSTRNPHGVKDNYIPTITEQNPQYLVFGFEGIHLLQTLMRTFPFLFNRISGNCRNLLLPLRSLLIGKPLLCRGGGHNGYHHTVQLSYLKSIFFQSTTEIRPYLSSDFEGGKMSQCDTHWTLCALVSAK
ncbi:hypothetical protein PVL30_002712 [Lodderomyces elongisporus]|uniref:uncharacterized protein n=1 Tax=Lodderomyces elongisporus TaxID=36914 RepID=UPI002922CF7C|nr:uncharacterized protein PVL30_002712 [Lodderomyces elongisporus]WLF78964.1 hypothetical protein PVL30_002712 [Lodderomyces elongisporus]